MEPTGMIFAALDCDADAIEDWNRWYDLEHTPMNVCLPGVLLSRRYVAPPDLHAVRLAAAGSPFAQGKASFLTTYVLAGDPRAAFNAMSVELPRLYEGGRMRFPAEKKTVRDGDVFSGRAAVAVPSLQLRGSEVPFVQHTGVVVVLTEAQDDRAGRLVGVDGVLAVWSLASLNRTLYLDVFLVEGDPATCALAMRAAVPHRAPPVVDAPFLLINPLQYPWADEIRASDLPQTIG